MSQYPNDATGPAGRVHAHPVVALRDQLTQTLTAANQLRSDSREGRRPRTQAG